MDVRTVLMKRSAKGSRRVPALWAYVFPNIAEGQGVIEQFPRWLISTAPGTNLLLSVDAKLSVQMELKRFFEAFKQLRLGVLACYCFTLFGNLLPVVVWQSEIPLNPLRKPFRRVIIHHEV